MERDLGEGILERAAWILPSEYTGGGSSEKPRDHAFDSPLTHVYEPFTDYAVILVLCLGIMEPTQVHASSV